MFFKTSDITLYIASVLKLSWEERNENSDLRPYHAISYRIKGDAQFVHESGSTFAKTGDIVFVPARYNYTLKASGEKLIVVHFSSNSNLPGSIHCMTPENASYFERKFSELYLVWSKKQFGYEHECKSILYKILMKIEQEFAHTKISDGYDKILEAVEFIHDNFADSNFSVDYLSKMCGMSDTYFRKLFVKRFSCTPIRYVIKLKLNFATELLRSGYYTVQEVSDKCGFTTVNYFSAFMKKETGRTPSDFFK